MYCMYVGTREFVLQPINILMRERFNKTKLIFRES